MFGENEKIRLKMYWVYVALLIGVEIYRYELEDREETMRRHSDMPVSYTHLDVYKRQAGLQVNDKIFVYYTGNLDDGTAQVLRVEKYVSEE